MKNDEILHKWVNGTLNAKELEEFKLRPEYDSLVELYKNTDHLSAPKWEGDPVLAEILKIEKKELWPVDTGKRRFLSSWMKYAAAASVLLLATWFFWPKAGMVVYELAKGERKEGVLPDQSMFALNEESTLSYDAGNWKEDRSLKLNGEAFFSVSPGSKFTVKTPNGSIQVLGTQFNVRSEKGVLEVKCQSGKVAVLSTEGQVLDELNPNDAVRIVNNKTTDKWQLQSGDKASWKSGISSFKKVRLEIVLEELEKQYAVDIDAGAVDVNEILSCNFQHTDLEMALKTTLTPLGIKYNIEKGNKIILRK